MYMASQGESKKSLSDRLVDNHLLGISIALYIIIAIPMYFWLDGPVGNVGTIGPGVVVPALVMGSILVVPIIMSTLRARRLDRGFSAGSDASD